MANMVKITSNGNNFLIRMEKRFAIVKEDAYKAAKSALKPAHESAVSSVMDTIYSRPANSKYPRSMNLWMSVDADVKRTKKGAILTVFHSPALATQAFPWASDKNKSWAVRLNSYSGDYKYYPSYVLQGNFFGNKVSEDLDYIAKWKKNVPKILVSYLEGTMISHFVRDK